MRSGRPAFRLGVVTAALLAAGWAPEPRAQSVRAPATPHSELAPAMNISAGKSALLRLPDEATRISVGNPAVADIMLLSGSELYLLGKTVGTTNVVVWYRQSPVTVIDVNVGLDTAALKARLEALMPQERHVRVDALAETVVLSGQVSDPLKAQRLMLLAEAFSGGRKVVNLMGVAGSQQVMLEVKVAEVSKTLVDRLGAQFNSRSNVGNSAFTLIARFLTGAGAGATLLNAAGNGLSIDAEVNRGLLKILAEPTIMATSGQEGTFLAGGKIFIPVAVGSGSTGTISLEEREFGVGLRFTPTLLEDGMINLRVTPEVSELSQVGTSVSGGTGQTSVLPTMTTRRVSTTVQLRDGESFAIGGLIKSNVTEAMKALPGLGELPVLGALFRSSEFQSDRSELLFAITPHLVHPTAAAAQLPTDGFTPPTRSEFLFEGRQQGRASVPPPATAGGLQAGPHSGGLQ